MTMYLLTAGGSTTKDVAPDFEGEEINGVKIITRISCSNRSFIDFIANNKDDLVFIGEDIKFVHSFEPVLFAYNYVIGEILYNGIIKVAYAHSSVAYKILNFTPYHMESIS